MRPLGPGMMQQIQQVCSKCSGKGYSIPPSDQCGTCHGERLVNERKVFEVHVDKGIRHKGKVCWCVGCLFWGVFWGVLMYDTFWGVHIEKKKGGTPYTHIVTPSPPTHVEPHPPTHPTHHTLYPTPPTQIVLSGEAGTSDPDLLPGDIIFLIDLKPHDTFKRVGHDLVYEKHVSLVEALTGCEFTIRQLDDRMLHVKMPEGHIVKPDSWVKIEVGGVCVCVGVLFLCVVCGVCGVCGWVYVYVWGGVCVCVCVGRGVKWFARHVGTHHVSSFTHTSPPYTSHTSPPLTQEEGMPVQGRPFVKGNLYVEFVVDFPDTLDTDAITHLKAALPAAPTNGHMDADDDELEEVKVSPIEDMKAELQHRAEMMRKSNTSAYESDSDDEMRAGGLRCAHQ